MKDDNDCGCVYHAEEGTPCQHDNDHGGTSLTAGEAVSVSASDQLSHAAPKHTPGPWTVVQYNEVIAPCNEHRNCHKTIVFGINNHGAQALKCSVGPNTTANAHLIAAAPEMYEALKAVHALRIVWPADVEVAVVAAIAKAEGRQP